MLEQWCAHAKVAAEVLAEAHAAGAYRPAEDSARAHYTLLQRHLERCAPCYSARYLQRSHKIVSVTPTICRGPDCPAAGSNFDISAYAD